MVNLFELNIELADHFVLAQQKSESVLSKLDPERRAKVLAALAGLILLGFGLVMLAWLGARFTRRYMNPPGRRRDRVGPDPDDWAEKPIVHLKDPPSENAL